MLPKSEQRSGTSYGQDQRKQQEKDKLRAAAVGTAIGQVIDSGKLGSGDLIRLLTRALVARTWDDSEKKIMSRRGVEKVKGKGARGVLETYLHSMKKPAEVAGLGLELALWTFAPTRWGSTEREWGETLKAAGVNFAAIEKRLAAEAKAKKAARKPKGKKKAKAKATS